jgi:hypothetical protein
MFSNGPSIVKTGLDLLIDAADRQSYPGSGTVWTDLRSGTTGSLTGSVAYTSEFYGGLTFSNSSSAVIFPSTTANYGTGSFTVEMAFKPTFINGRHYLMSKNSGSFPNWAIYLSGSAGAGKLWSEFNINASVSCSVSSSTTFVTGSVYQVDVRILPGASASGIYVNGQTEGGVLGNGGGTLSNTASLFVGNFSQNNTQNFSGSIYAIKTYLGVNLNQPLLNYNATATRIQKNPTPFIPKVFELLVVAGGGGGGTRRGGGGGAGGLQYFPSLNIEGGTQIVTVGAGGAGGNSATSGNNSSFSTYMSIGGGRGGGETFSAQNGGSGGGAWYTTITGSGTAGQGTNGVNTPLTLNSAGGGGGSSTPGLLNAGGSGSYIASFAAIGGSPEGWFAGGGGGYTDATGKGGIGGGGDSGVNFGNGKTGSVNTGGGGGGGGRDSGGLGAAGGSGIVAIRYSGTPIAVGGEITQSAGFTYHVFRTTGSSTFTIF